MTAKKTPRDEQPSAPVDASTAVIFIRGLGREQQHWGSFPQQVQAQSSGSCQVFFVDLPGNGDLRDRESPMTLQPYAQHLESSLNSLPLGHFSEVRLVAISMAAMVVLKWLEDREDSVIERFCLINTSCGQLSPFYKRLIPSAIPYLTTFLGKATIEDKERAILNLVANDAEARERNLGHWVDIHRQRTTLPGNLVRQMLASASFRQLRPPPLKSRITMIAAKGDRMVDYSCGAALADYLDCPLVLHADAGHDLPLDDPSWLARQVWASRPVGHHPATA